MTSKTRRALLSAVLIGGALSLVLVSTTRGSVAYMHVDEVMPQAADWYGKNLKLHGNVVPGSIAKRPNTADYRFQIRSGDAVVLATFTGIVPDTFKDDSEVVLTGQLSADGFHVAPGGITAKCPSKYEAGAQQPKTTSY